MKKRKTGVLLILIIMTAVICSHFDQTDSPSVESEEPKEERETETEEESGEEDGGYLYPVIEEHKAEDGKVHSYLTGAKVDASIGNRRPIAVMIPNNSAAQPQYGISKAGVIYEACVEGRITRLMGIFEDFDDLNYIGPVRSSRDY